MLLHVVPLHFIEKHTSPTSVAGAGSGNPAFLHALFLENEKQNSRKNYEAMFSHQVQGHLEAKKRMA